MNLSWRKRKLWFLLSFAPLLMVLPHWGEVLRTSPLDRVYCMIFAPLALFAAVWGWKKSRGHRAENAVSVWPPLRRPGTVADAILIVVFSALFGIGLYFRLNLLTIIAALTVIFATAAAFFGFRRRLLYFLPAALLLLPAVPGFLFWSTRAAAFATFAERSFPVAMADFSRLTVADGFLARRGSPTAAEKILFRTAEIEVYNCVRNKDFFVATTTLAGDDEHEIHPAAFCLKTHGFKVVSEEIFTFTPDNSVHQPFEIERVIAVAGDCRRTIWTWYSSAAESTASYFHFRRHCRDGVWRRYTLSTDCAERADEVFSAVLSLVLVD